jgi:hypothetical protein
MGLVQRFRVHAGAVVRDADAHVSTRLQRRRRGGHTRIHMQTFDGHGDFSTLGHGVARVDAQIEDRAFKLVGIAQSLCQAIELEAQCDAFAQRTAQEIAHAVDQWPRIYRLRVQRLTA